MALRGVGAESLLLLLLLFVWLPVMYALAWTFVVVPLDRALDVDG